MIGRLQAFWRVKIYVPLKDNPEGALLDRVAAESLDAISGIQDALASVPDLGALGNYDGVFELDFGLEGYTPKEGAEPAVGRIGQKVIVGRVALITYITRDATEEMLTRLVDVVAAAHPWEHPIIELSECRLLVPC